MGPITSVEYIHRWKKQTLRLTSRIHIAGGTPASLVGNADGQDVGLLHAGDGARGKVVEGDVHGQETTTIITTITKLFEARHLGSLSSLRGGEKVGAGGAVGGLSKRIRSKKIES